MNAQWLIENKLRPGHYWNANSATFESLHSGDFSLYTTQAKAVKSAQKPAQTYSIRIVKLENQ